VLHSGLVSSKYVKKHGDKILPCGKPALIFEIPAVEELC